MLKHLCAIGFLTILIGLQSQFLCAATQVQVNASGRSCLSHPLPVYTTIQAAVTAVSSSGTVFVCPGTYPEQVAISQPLTLQGVQSGVNGAAVVTPPASGLKMLPGTSTFPQIFVNNISSGLVTIDNLTLDATTNFVGCGLMEAVYFKYASGTMKHLATRNQSVPICGNSLGLRVLGDTANANVTVANNSVRGYSGGQPAGILAQGSLANVVIQNNAVWGPGSIGVTTEGIWMLDGATGTITGNSIVDNSNISPAAVGILVQGSHGVTMSRNTLGNNAYGIEIISDPGFDADHGTASQNTILGNGIDGVYACSSNNVIENNTITGNIESGVNLPSVSGTCSANNNTVTNNTINEACAGVLFDPSVTGNVITPNTIFNATTLIMRGISCAASSHHAPIQVPHGLPL